MRVFGGFRQFTCGSTSRMTLSLTVATLLILRILSRGYAIGCRGLRETFEPQTSGTYPWAFSSTSGWAVEERGQPGDSYFSVANVSCPFLMETNMREVNPRTSDLFIQFEFMFSEAEERASIDAKLAFDGQSCTESPFASQAYQVAFGAQISGLTARVIFSVGSSSGQLIGWKRGAEYKKIRDVFKDTKWHFLRLELLSNFTRFSICLDDRLIAEGSLADEFFEELNECEEKCDVRALEVVQLSRLNFLAMQLRTTSGSLNLDNLLITQDREEANQLLGNSTKIHSWKSGSGRLESMRRKWKPWLLYFAYIGATFCVYGFLLNKAARNG